MVGRYSVQEQAGAFHQETEGDQREAGAVPR
jgi:hypothetical protein